MLHALYTQSIIAALPFNFKAIFDFPGVQYLVTAVNILLGVIALFCVVTFLMGLGKLVGSLHSGHTGASSGPSKQIIGSVGVLVIVFTFSSFLNGWISIISG